MYLSQCAHALENMQNTEIPKYNLYTFPIFTFKCHQKTNEW